MKVILAAFALIAAGLGFWWFAPSQENFKIFALIGFVLILCAVGLLLQHAGELGNTLKGWTKHGLPATGFAISLAFAVWLAHDAYLDGLLWWKELHVQVAFGVALLLGLATVGALVPLLKGLGSLLYEALSGKFSAWIAVPLWLAILLALGFFTNYFGKLEAFEDHPDMAKGGELLSIGLFTAVFVGIVFGFTALIFSRKK